MNRLHRAVLWVPLAVCPIFLVSTVASAAEGPTFGQAVADWLDSEPDTASNAALPGVPEGLPAPEAEDSSLLELDERFCQTSHYLEDEAEKSADGGEPDVGTELKKLQADLKKMQDADKKKKEEEAKRPSLKWTMQLQADTYFFGQDEENREAVGDIQDGSGFRRARIGAFGDYDQYIYRIEMDYALSGRPSFLDAFVGMKDLPLLNTVRVGHFFEPFSFERMTPNRFLTFLERSLLDQAFVPARNTGVAFNDWNEEETMTWSAGVYRTNSDVFGDDVGDNGERSLTGRATWLPYYDEGSGGRHYLHLGSAYSFRDADGDNVRFRAQPEARIGATTPNVPFFVDTGDIPADYYQLIGLEAVFVSGPWAMQSEYVLTPVEQQNAGDPTFSGWYVESSYFLTGEHRPYRRQTGTFDRVIPFEDFFRVDTRQGVCTGLGAWQVAARLSHLDLDDATVAGGTLTDATLGLNWHLNPYTRLQWNYIHAFLDDPALDRSNADIVGMRAGFDY